LDREILTTKFSKNAQRTQRKMSELGFVGLKDFGILFFRAKAHSSFYAIP
jgi:hypothetical protein